MASIGILYFIFTVLCITAVKTGGFVNVKCKTENIGHYGQQSLLECVIQTSKDVQDPIIRVVAWKKKSSPEDEDGKIMLGYNRGDSKKIPGYRFAEASWDEKNMNVSLLITNTAVTDEGLYSCMVVTDSGDHTSSTTLKVQAKYSAPTVHSIPEKIVSNANSALICESDGGYPEGKLRWFDNQHNEWTKSSKMEVKQTPSGLFKLKSTLDLLSGSTFSRYTCAVFNASGGKEDEITFEIPPSSPLGSTEAFSAEPSKIVAPLVVIGSLIIGLLCALLLYRRRSQKARRDSTAPLMDNHHAVYISERDAEAGGAQSNEEKASPESKCLS